MSMMLKISERESLLYYLVVCHVSGSGAAWALVNYNDLEVFVLGY